MKKVSRRILARTVTQELLAGKSVTQVSQQLAAYLLTHRMTDQIDRLLLDIAAELQETTGHATATVTTVFKPTEQNLDTLRHSLKHLIDAREVELKLREDTSLVGGMIVTLPGRELDASVRRKLRLLARGGAA
jgi:F0F1-type ATP synthase delta subunit